MLAIIIAVIVTATATYAIARFRYTARLGSIVLWMATTPQGRLSFETAARANGADVRVVDAE